MNCESLPIYVAYPMTSAHANTPPLVAIIILNWNGKDDTLECLTSVMQLDYLNYEVVVVDNGSTDGSYEAISKQYPDITLLQTGDNLGYAGGNNIGVRYALDKSAEYVLLLNNDTTVDPDMLSAFVQASAVIPNAGVFGARIYFYDNPTTIWFAGGRWRHDKAGFEHVGFGKEDGPEFDHASQIDYATGCALFARSEVFRSIGLLDERYFLTYEETDWCYRAKNAGFLNYYVPNAKLWHKVSVSFGGSESPLIKYFMTRNLLLWGSSHLPYLQRLSLYLDTWSILRATLLPTFHMDIDQHSLLKRFIWAYNTWNRCLMRKLKEPHNRATLYGLRDFFLRRFGDCPPVVRQLASRKSRRSEPTTDDH